MKARIYQPAKNAMQQAGQENNNHWLLDFPRSGKSFIDPLMGWTGMTDTTRQLHIEFKTLEEAVDYAKKNEIPYEIQEPEKRVIKPKSYAANFAYNRVREGSGANN